MALPLVHAARHNDVKPLLGRELMILTHDDDDVCMYAEEMITTTIEQITKRRRMTAVEREALQISCDRCGKQFSRPQDLKRHNSQMPDCGTVKRRMTVAERAKLPFKCETCGERFSRQQEELATSVRVHRARRVEL